MTGLLSGISGHFPRQLTLGTLLPVVVFALFLQASIAPFELKDWQLLATLAQLDASWQLAATTLLTVVAAGLLYVLNNPVIRLYEGYPWRASRLGRRRIRRPRRRLETAMAQEKLLRHLRRALARRDREDPRIAALSAWEADLGRQIFGAFPRPALVLPTELGNVIRSFEDYPERQFQMAGITMWPRLVAKIPKDYAMTIDDAKTRFDLMINSSFLAALLALVITVDGLLRPAPFVALPALLAWLAKIGVCLALALLFYQGSVSRAAAWGRTIKSAFELYRLDLLESLGFRQTPASLAEERSLWLELRYQMEFGDPAGKPPALRYETASKAPEAPTYARGSLDAASFEVSRGVEPEGAGVLRIFVRVKNIDPERDAAEVTVVDTPPEGFAYRWGSARLDGRRIEAAGTHPYRFPVGDLAHGHEATLSYGAVAIEKARRMHHEGTLELARSAGGGAQG